MVSVKKETFIEYRSAMLVVRAAIYVDSAEERPEAFDGILGKILSQGSVALDISTGDFYCLTSTGEWINQNRQANSGFFE